MIWQVLLFWTIWRELHFSSKGGLGASKRGPMSSFWWEKRVPAKFLTPKRTNQLFLWYWYGDYQENTNWYQQKIPNQYKTLVKMTLCTTWGCITPPKIPRFYRRGIKITLYWHTMSIVEIQHGSYFQNNISILAVWLVSVSYCYWPVNISFAIFSWWGLLKIWWEPLLFS